MASASDPDPPYAVIHHVQRADLDDPPAAPGGTGRSLTVVWDADRPVGQFWSGQVGPIMLVTPASPRDGHPAVSTTVVICTRDRPDMLRRCLESLTHQSRRPDQIIVVDNASRTDDTRRVAAEAGVDYVREDRPGLDFARNSGARAARGAIIAYTDDDTEIHAAWLERLVAAFDDERIAAVTGLVLPARLDTQAQWIFERQWSFGCGFEGFDRGDAWYRETRRRGCPAWTVGAGANMAFRRSAFDAVGLFDERLDVGAAGCSGDSEYWYRLLAHGMICRYEPAAIVFHHHRLEMAGLASQIFHYMRGHACALLIQFERTGDWGNVRRLFLALPIYYTRRLLGRIVRGRGEHNAMLRHEVLGMLAGIAYYLRAERPR